VIIHQVNDAPTFHLYVRTSFAWYLAEWLLDAMTEYCFNVPSLQGGAGEGAADLVVPYPRSSPPFTEG
jgi:hypothetical protein